MSIFMVYVVNRPWFFLDNTRFGFELVNQKMFEMKISKMAHFTYLVIFHLKMIVCQNINFPHTYGYCPKKSICGMIIIKLFTMVHNLFQSYGIIILIYTTNFIQIQNYFNLFWSIFAFFNMM
jgi:hypothetical protein